MTDLPTGTITYLITDIEGDGSAAMAWAEGRDITLEQAVAYALEETTTTRPTPQRLIGVVDR